MNKKGFTLVELLAVLVVLAIIMVIAGTAVTKTKKETAKQECQKLEKSIEDMGSNIYSFEMISGIKNNSSCMAAGECSSDTDQRFKKFFYNMYKAGGSFIITLDELREANYAKSLVKEGSNYKILNPFGGPGCDAYLLVNPSSDDEKFKGYLDCGSNYKTSGYDASNLPKADLTK